MFENDGKKEMNKIKGMNKFQPGNSSTVYGELKLSEKLTIELDKVRKKFEDQQEYLESVIYERDELRIQIS